MSVFTTQTLLSSVGISRNAAAPGAVAINWVLKVNQNFINALRLIISFQLFSYGLQ